MGRYPAPAGALQAWLPTYPAPPVTRIASDIRANRPLPGNRATTMDRAVLFRSWFWVWSGVRQLAAPGPVGISARQVRFGLHWPRATTPRGQSGTKMPPLEIVRGWAG